jgi:uncharacterized protein (UPF0335 family)
LNQAQHRAAICAGDILLARHARGREQAGQLQAPNQKDRRMAEDSVAQDQLRAFIERIERMEEEKSAIAADIKEIYAEAKGNGFDTKILRKIVAIRKQDANERMEQEALLELYMSALGMVAAPSDD